MNSNAAKLRKYRVGIDVGTHSIGFCAVEVDQDGSPVELLNSMVFIHDSGIDPGGAKTAQTRKLVSGVARRTRRLYRTRRKRLADLDATLTQLGYPLVSFEDFVDPRYPWFARADLADGYIKDDTERLEALSVAFRHIARHRGWRSPYSRVESLLADSEPSSFLTGLRERIEARTFQELSSELTPGQLLANLLESNEMEKVRGPEGILAGKLHQADNATEVRKICRMQGISEADANLLVRKIFQAKSPRGSAKGRVGKDVLPGQGRLPRAEHAHPAYQRFRVVSTLANLRIATDGQERRLTREEMEAIADFLATAGRGEAPTWSEVADNLSIERSQLRGTATGVDGAPAMTRPPVDVTDRAILGCKVKWLKDWWKAADYERRCALIDYLSNSGGSSETVVEDDELEALFEQASEGDFEQFEAMGLPSGRARYSVDSLERLSERMLADGCDLHEARKREFKVDDSWKPPAVAVGEPVGNPAVDRVLKQVSRWLEAAVKKWGIPEAINIEHVRHALGSERALREAERENTARRKKNEATVAEMRQKLGLGEQVRMADVRRYQAVMQQNCQCLYCGAPIDYFTAELDHIVPRAGMGSTNTRTNLVAACRTCNHLKSNTPFAVWAARDGRPEVSLEAAKERVQQWLALPGLPLRVHKKYLAEVKRRLETTRPDEEIDGRSLESVAWMANELRHRIEQRFTNAGEETAVRVFRGALTAEARKASGFEGRVKLIGGNGKSRFDRRHHAMDALTAALMRPAVAQTLALRINLRDSQRLTREAETWKEFQGRQPGDVRNWQQWLSHMRQACDLFNYALEIDAIPVMQNKRLRVGNGEAHEATIKKFVRKRVGDAWTAEEVDRASSPALWTALTRSPGFDYKKGLPANPDRKIRVNGRHFGPADTVDLFGVKAACLPVRGGYAEIGAGIHHARIFRIEGKKTSYAMLRVYHVDLLRHRHEDLFTVQLAESCISMRTAEPKLREALRAGTAVQTGWLVEGDELLLDMASFNSGQIGEFLKMVPNCRRWRVNGYYGTDKLRLRPAYLSSEGLGKLVSWESTEIDAAKKIVDMPGWRPAVNQAIGAGKAKVIRRTAIGYERRGSDDGLPTVMGLN